MVPSFDLKGPKAKRLWDLTPYNCSEIYITASRTVAILGFLIGDLQVEFLFESHNQFHHIQ